MSVQIEGMIRAAYAAFARGDVDGYLAACTEDFQFHVPGSSGISGTYSGREGIHDLGRKAMSLTGGTFAEDVEDVLANESHAVVLARHRFTAGGVPRDYRTAHVYDLAGGKLSRCYEQPRDPAAFEAAWGHPQSAGKGA